MSRAVHVPYFESPEPRPSAPRLLLISYHFPPAPTAGAVRWEKLAHHAAERGWALDVVALLPSRLSAADCTRLAALPAGIRVYGVPETTVWAERLEHGVRRLARRLVAPAVALAGRRAPDAGPTTGGVAGRLVRHANSLGRAEIRWTLRRLPSGLRRAYFAWLHYARQERWAAAVEALCLRLGRTQTYQAIVSCGPPHMAHEAGRRVAVATGRPLVMDLRDPWSQAQRFPEAVASPVGLALAERYERRTLAQARVVAVNTEPFRLALQAKYPQASARILTVMNGYDEDPVPPSRHAGPFTIAYAGTIYLDRDPRVLFKAAAQVVREQGLSRGDFRIALMGDVERFDGIPTATIAREEGLDGHVTTRPPAGRREVMDFLADASVLLSLPQDSDMAIPSKIFEYMQYDAWILALADHGSATERLLRDSAADVVAPSDLAGLVRVLRTRYQQHARGERPVRLATDPRYSRRRQAQILFDHIERCLNGGGATRCRGEAPARQMTGA
jgi:glycosyltransferase involved in cell wall biosynthesis